MTPAISDTGSLIDGPARTVVLVLGGVTVLGWLLAWLLCRAAAAADRVEPGCDGEWEWVDYCGRHSRHTYTRQAGVWRCLICDEPQRATEVYDHAAIERLHADLAAWERGER